MTPEKYWNVCSFPPLIFKVSQVITGFPLMLWGASCKLYNPRAQCCQWGEKMCWLDPDAISLITSRSRHAAITFGRRKEAKARSDLGQGTSPSKTTYLLFEEATEMTLQKCWGRTCEMRVISAECSRSVKAVVEGSSSKWSAYRFILLSMSVNYTAMVYGDLWLRE